jgi:hypothetical protein
MPNLFEELAGIRGDVLFAQMASVLSTLIAVNHVGLPISVFVQDAKETKISGTYHWDARNFAIIFSRSHREGRAPKLIYPVTVEFRDGMANPAVIATLIVKNAGTAVSPELSSELR